MKLKTLEGWDKEKQKKLITLIILSTKTINYY